MNIIKNLYKKNNNPALITITALGDSLTYGWLVNKGYLDFLSEMLYEKYPEINIKIKNLGVPGDTARDGLRRIKEVIKTKPDLCMIQFALNDAFSGITPEVFKQTVEQIIRKITSETSAELLLLTSIPIISPYENKIAEAFYARIFECGVEFNIPVVQVHEYWKKKISGGIKHVSLIQEDGVHPLENGYILIAEAIMEML